jgi:DNA ligase-associated metallophosphoesterase
VSAAPSFRYAFGAASCGGLALEVAGVTVTCRASGALWLADEAALIVADLHLEKGSAYASRGQMLPPYDTRDTLGRLEAEVAALSPRMLIYLGDTFHDRRAQQRMAPQDAERLERIGQNRRVVWVVGNHDADGPTDLSGEILADLALLGLLLRHEPAEGPSPGEVSGHLHPCATVIGQGQSVRRRCFVSDGERIILPAFGAYAGGLSVRDPAFASLFARRPIIGALGAGRVHAVGWKAVTGEG